MSEERKKFETWEEVIIDFFESKKISAEELYLKDRLKAIGDSYGRRLFFGNQRIEFLFDTKKNKKGNDQTSIGFQRDRFQKVMELTEKPEDIDVEKEFEDYSREQTKLAEKFDARHWLTENCKNASNVSFATHVIKLTHSAIDASSFFDEISCTRKNYITTSCLKDKVVDGAVKGNQYAPIYQFLELELRGVKLASALCMDDCDTLNAFSKDENESEEWKAGFREAISGGKAGAIKSHILAKQIYFPINRDHTNSKYRLLCNVKSSSMAQSIYDRMDKRNNLVNNQRKKGNYFNQPDSYIPKAILNVTASNHGNASQLNGKRGGRLNLLSCEPPVWQSKLMPPIKHKSLFGHAFYLPDAKEDIDYLRDFLLRFEKLGLSFKTPERWKWIENWVGGIAEQFLAYVVSIQKLPAGWSGASDIVLKCEHQYLLDPFRQDDKFQSARQATDWQAVVCDDFGRWLNGKLSGRDKKFTPQPEHRRMWAELLEEPLRKYNDLVESERARIQGGKV